MFHVNIFKCFVYLNAIVIKINRTFCFLFVEFYRYFWHNHSTIYSRVWEHI